MNSRRRGGASALFAVVAQLKAMLLVTKTLKTSRQFVIFFGGLAFGLLLFTIVTPHAYAADASWVNRGKISYQGQTYVGPSTANVNGSNPEGYARYTSETVACNLGGNGSRNFIEFEKDPTNAANKDIKGYYDQYSVTTGTGGPANTAGCGKTVTNREITLDNWQNATLSSAQASCTNGSPAEQSACFDRQVAIACASFSNLADKQQCEAQQRTQITGGLAPNTGTGGGAATPDAAADSPTCEASGFNLSWLLCPFYNGISGFVDWIVTGPLDTLLKSKPISTTPGDPVYDVWSAFRTYGNIFLIIALIIIVFGQSIGGGMVDAYTAKKVLPRILIAAVLINLSIYVVAALVDITNVIGGGIGQIINAPLDDAGSFKITMSGVTANLVGATSAFALLAAGGAGLIAILGSVSVLPFLLLFIIMPVILSLILVVITLVLRQAIILALVMVAPVAFALYCLPNTEQYFKKWWSLLIQTLLVYPIVIVIFAVANVLSVTSAVVGGFGAVISFLLQFIPLLFIPYAFKLAGGVLGRLHDLVTSKGQQGMGFIKGSANNPNSLQNRLKGNMVSNFRDSTSVQAGKLSTSRSKALRYTGARLRSPRLVEKEALDNAQRGKEIDSTWQNGDDTFVKASTIHTDVLDDRKQRGYRYRAAGAAGNIEEQWQTADGAWYTKQQIVQGNRAYDTGGDRQHNFRNMIGKTEPLGEEAQNLIREDFMAYANAQKMDAGAATGRWQGMAIPTKGMRIDQRRQKIRQNADTGQLEWGDVDHKGLLTEYAGFKMGDQLAQTPGGFRAIAQSAQAIRYKQGASIDEQVAAANAYKNLERYVTGAAGEQGAAQLEAAVQQPESGGKGPTSTFATSGSAAYKNAEGARRAYQKLKEAGYGEWASGVHAANPNYGQVQPPSN